MSVPENLEKFLKSISGQTCHRRVLKIYAPTCRGECVPAVNRLIKRVNAVTKGSTVYDAAGSWLDDKTGDLVREPVKVIEAGHGCLDERDAQRIAEAIRDYSIEARQRQLAVVENQFYLGDTPEIARAYMEPRWGEFQHKTMRLQMHEKKGINESFSRHGRESRCIVWKHPRSRP